MITLKKLVSTEPAAAPAKPYVAPTAPEGGVSTGGIRAWLVAQAAPVRKFEDLKLSERKLWQLVEAEVASNPVAREGHHWAARRFRWYAKQLEVSERQVRRLVRSIPLCRVQVLHQGTKVLLLRTGNPAEKTPEDFARIMSAQWQKRIGERPSQREFGMLVGMGRESAEWAPDILRTGMNDWTGFMAGVALAVDAAEHSGDEFCDDPEKFYKIYLAFPSIATLRRFWYVAVEFYDMMLQDQLAATPHDKNLSKVADLRFQ